MCGIYLVFCSTKPHGQQHLGASFLAYVSYYMCGGGWVGFLEECSLQGLPDTDTAPGELGKKQASPTLPFSLLLLAQEAVSLSAMS